MTIDMWIWIDEYPYMHKTTLLLPEDLKREASRIARKRKMNLSELIRAELSRVVQEEMGSGMEQDSLFGSAVTGVKGLPSDLSVKHDRYLYGD